MNFVTTAEVSTERVGVELGRADIGPSAFTLAVICDLNMLTRSSAGVVVAHTIHAANRLSKSGARAVLAYALAASLAQLTIYVTLTVRRVDAYILDTHLWVLTIGVDSTAIRATGTLIGSRNSGAISATAVVIGLSIDTADGCKTAITLTAIRAIQFIGAVFTVCVSVTEYGVFITDTITTIDDVFSARLGAVPTLRGSASLR